MDVAVAAATPDPGVTSVRLMAVCWTTDEAVNVAKGEDDTATWLPPNKSFRSNYVARQVSVKKKYDL